MSDDDSKPPVLKDNELLELSIVPTPANPRAIALGLKEGSINRKNATWRMDSMRKEAEALEVQLKEQPDGEDEDMNTTELSKQ